MSVQALFDSPALRRALLPSAVTAVVVYRILTSRWSGDWSGPPVIPSPMETKLSTLSEQQQRDLPYPPDALPGARDVDTPYGSIRVYEWGPEDGEKVLLIHGISTPCISLAGVAKLLAEKGCRVMLFDLFGRGFSAAPDPVSNPQNIQLFTSQILLVLTSSPLSWTGSSTFSIIGYSLGGGIATSFTSYFPHLVDSLVLIAPAGLLRSTRIAWSSRLIYSGLVPQGVVDYLVRKRLSSNSSPTGPGKSGNPEATPGRAVISEIPSKDHPALTPDSRASLYADRPTISVADAVQWQLQHHQGFLPAFISSIQHAPVSQQHERWRIIGSRLAAQRLDMEDEQKSRQGLRHGRVLMILGADDGVIVKDEIEADAREVLGGGLAVQTVTAGHDLPVVKPAEVANAILDFWEDGGKA